MRIPLVKNSIPCCVTKNTAVKYSIPDAKQHLPQGMNPIPDGTPPIPHHKNNIPDKIPLLTGEKPNEHSAFTPKKKQKSTIQLTEA